MDRNKKRRKRNPKVKRGHVRIHSLKFQYGVNGGIWVSFSVKGMEDSLDIFFSNKQLGDGMKNYVEGTKATAVGLAENWLVATISTAAQEIAERRKILAEASAEGGQDEPEEATE